MRDLVRHGRPIQYAHIPEPLMLWDVWTKIAADPIAFESPSAGFALDWRALKSWRERGVGFATLAHAAGLSSTTTPPSTGGFPSKNLIAFRRRARESRHGTIRNAC
jgi:S-adenosylmethionine:tRNA ribosyltransferase-isomerase